MERGRKAKMGRRQTLKRERRQRRRERKEKMARKFMIGPEEIKEKHARLLTKYYESLIESDGKKLQLSCVKKYTKPGCSHINNYCITLEAEDPDMCGSPLTFQTEVSEERYRKLDLQCRIARLLGETKNTGYSEIKHLDKDSKVLELPQENPFVEDGTNRFRLLKDSELQDNDWIRLYLELAVATTNKKIGLDSHSLTSLKILKVAMERTQGLCEFDAVFYIEYEDSCEARVGKDVHRVAIVRRILDKQSELLNLFGHNQSINKSASMEACSSSAQD